MRAAAFLFHGRYVSSTRRVVGAAVDGDGPARSLVRRASPSYWTNNFLICSITSGGWFTDFFRHRLQLFASHRGDVHAKFFRLSQKFRVFDDLVEGCA